MVYQPVLRGLVDLERDHHAVTIGELHGRGQAALALNIIFCGVFGQIKDLHQRKFSTIRHAPTKTTWHGFVSMWMHAKCSQKLGMCVMHLDVTTLIIILSTTPHAVYEFSPEVRGTISRR